MPPAVLAFAPAVEHVPFSEVLGALSRALDLTEGQPAGHTMRSCLVGMRIGRELGLDDVTLSALHYALLLKDAGCSSNAARMCALFGADDRVVKRRMKLVDWHDRARLALATWRLAALGAPLGEKARRFVGIARTEHMTRDLMQVRCERGADIALRLGFPELTANAPAYSTTVYAQADDAAQRRIQSIIVANDQSGAANGRGGEAQVRTAGLAKPGRAAQPRSL